MLSEGGLISTLSFKIARYNQNSFRQCLRAFQNQLRGNHASRLVDRWGRVNWGHTG